MTLHFGRLYLPILEFFIKIFTYVINQHLIFGWVIFLHIQECITVLKPVIPSFLERLVRKKLDFIRLKHACKIVF